MAFQSTFNSLSKNGYFNTASSNQFLLFDTIHVANASSFGWTIDISKNGNTLVVGAPSTTANTSNVYAFNINGLSKFNLTNTITNPNNLLEFGRIVSTSSNAQWTSIATGIRAASVNEKLYIYNNFSFNSNFVGSNANTSQYGSTVYMNDDGDFVGVTDPRTNIQTAYFYNRSGNTWSLHSNIVFSNTVAAPQNLILNSDGSKCFIAVNTTNSLTNGEVQIYSRSNTTWTLDQTITASDSLANDYFGTSMAINTTDNILIVGAPQTSESNIANVGGVYVFEYSVGNSQWEQTFKLVPNTISANLRIGNVLQGIDINTSNIIVGTQGRDAGSNNSVYVWKYDTANTTWDFLSQITSPYGNDIGFGRSISLSDTGNILMIGQPSANSVLSNVYQYMFV